MLKQRLESYQIKSSKKADGKDDIAQINDIIAELNKENKRVLSVNYGLGQVITILYEYED